MNTTIAQIIRWIGAFLLGITVLVAPWCYGSIYASAQLWLFPGVMLSLVCGLVALLFDGKTRWTFPVLLIPILLMLLLICLQLQPHDQATLARRSPKVAELREQLLPAPDSAEYHFTREMCPEIQSSADPAPTSIYPAVTRHQLSLFVLAVSAFFSAVVLFRDRDTIRLLGMAAVANGCILAMIGIMLRLNPQIKVFYFWENNREAFTTFINRNNAAGYLGMCLGLTIVFLLWYFFHSDREIESSQRWDSRFERAYMTSKQIIVYRFSRILTAGILTWGLLAGILIAGILASLSRGGSLAMGVALLISFLVVFATRRFKLSMLGFALIGLMGLGLIFWAGMDERVQKRLETILTGDNSARPRNWSNAIDTARDFQWRGSGFGTYQYANLLNDEFAKTNQIFIRAENQYIEIFLDLGVWGLLLLLVCLVTVVTLCWRLIWQQKDDWLTALGCGLLVAAMTQAVASLFDFGLYITANALLFAVCCGILSTVSQCTSGHSVNSENDVKNKQFTWWNHVSRVGLIVTGCLFLVLAARGNQEIRNIHRIDLATERLVKIGDYRTASPDELAEAIAQLDAAIQHRLDDAIATMYLAEAQIGLYRRAIYHDMLQESGSLLSEEEAWSMTDILSVHTSLGRLRRSERLKPHVQTIQEHPAVDLYLRPAFANLVRSRQANPMSISTHCSIVELVPILDTYDNQQEFEKKAIKRITTVAPLSPRAWFEAGILERNQGHTAEARSYWKQCLSLSRLYLVPIVQLTKVDMRGSNAKRLFQETFPNSPDLFLVLVTRYFLQRDIPSFHQEALEMLKDSCETADNIAEGERSYFRGRYEMLVGQYGSAITQFKAACSAQRTNHEWRYRLAQAYYSNQQYKDAEEEIKWALVYDPGNKTYIKLREEIQKAIITR